MAAPASTTAPFPPCLTWIDDFDVSFNTTKTMNVSGILYCSEKRLTQLERARIEGLLRGVCGLTCKPNTPPGCRCHLSLLD